VVGHALALITALPAAAGEAYHIPVYKYCPMYTYLCTWSARKQKKCATGRGGQPAQRSSAHQECRTRGAAMLAPMRHSIALLCLCPLAEPKTVTISNIVERRDVCVVPLLEQHAPADCLPAD
jgi:hypothetical protein